MLIEDGYESLLSFFTMSIVPMAGYIIYLKTKWEVKLPHLFRLLMAMMFMAWIITLIFLLPIDISMLKGAGATCITWILIAACLFTLGYFGPNLSNSRYHRWVWRILSMLAAMTILLWIWFLRPDYIRIDSDIYVLQSMGDVTDIGNAPVKLINLSGKEISWLRGEYLVNTDSGKYFHFTKNGTLSNFNEISIESRGDIVHIGSFLDSKPWFGIIWYK